MGIETIYYEEYIRSSGDCQNVAHKLDKKCTGKVSKETAMRWRDPFAPVNTHYEIWTSPQDVDVVVATFHKSEFSKDSELNLHCLWPIRFCILNRYWHAHCFNHALGYLEDLRATCLGLKYNVSKTVAKPAILYTKMASFKIKVLDLGI